MDLGNLVGKLFGVTPKYESVEANYHLDSSFTLSASRDGRNVEYKSNETYTVTTTSPLLSLFSKKLGGPMEEERFAPSVSIKTEEEETNILYDQEHDTTVVTVQRTDKNQLMIMKSGYQIMSNQSQMPEDTMNALVRQYQGIFKQEQRLLNVKKHHKGSQRATMSVHKT